MERAASSPPAGMNGPWAAFLAPVAVAGMVIAGALVVSLTVEAEPVDRPRVETFDPSVPAPASVASPSVSQPRRSPAEFANTNAVSPPARRRGFSPPLGSDEEDEAVEEQAPAPSPQEELQDAPEPTQQERVAAAREETRQALDKMPEEVLSRVPMMRRLKGAMNGEPASEEAAPEGDGEPSPEAGTPGSPPAGVGIGGAAPL